MFRSRVGASWRHLSGYLVRAQIRNATYPEASLATAASQKHYHINPTLNDGSGKQETAFAASE